MSPAAYAPSRLDPRRLPLLPVILQGGAEQVLGLGHGRSGAEPQLSLVCVLVLGLTLQRSIDGDRDLLHRRWLQEGKRLSFQVAF